jgi:hypothetical protein
VDRRLIVQASRFVGQSAIVAGLLSEIAIATALALYLRGQLHDMLKNSIYVGLIAHRKPAILVRTRRSSTRTCKLVRSVQVMPEMMTCTLVADAVAEVLETVLPDASSDIVLSVPLRLTRTGKVARLVQTDGRPSSATPVDQSLVRMIARARMVGSAPDWRDSRRSAGTRRRRQPHLSRQVRAARVPVARADRKDFGSRAARATVCAGIDRAARGALLRRPAAAIQLVFSGA